MTEPAPTRWIDRQVLTASFIGGSREVTFFHYGVQGARPKVYLQAGLHAGEMTGALALHHLRGLLEMEADQGTIRGEIVIAPLANPIGLGQFIAGDHFGRFESATLGNFNRDHFDVSESVAELVSGQLGQDREKNVAIVRAKALDVVRAIEDKDEWQSLRKHLLLRSIDADVCLDLHSDMSAAMFMYINSFDWPALSDLSAFLQCAAVVELAPFVPSRTFAGVVGSLWPRLAASMPGFPIPNACQSAMIEMRGRHMCTDAMAADDAWNLMGFLRQRGVLAGDAPPLPAPICSSVGVEGMDVGYAPSPGFVVFVREPGEQVLAGDTICHIIDPTAETSAEGKVAVLSRQNGCLYARALDGVLMRPGQVLFRIAGEARLAHRAGRSWLDD